MMQDQVDRKRSIGAAEKAAHLDEQIDQMVEMFRMAAESLGLRLHVTQYQMHGLTDARPFGRKRGRNVRRNDILATIDPTPGVYSYATGLLDHPLQRAVIAYTDPDDFADSAQLLAAGAVPMVSLGQDEHHFAMRRVFAVYTSPHETEAANLFSANANVVRRAVLYPQNPPLEQPRRHDEIIIPLEQLCDAEARRLLVERKTDAVEPSVRRKN